MFIDSHSHFGPRTLTLQRSPFVCYRVRPPAMANTTDVILAFDGDEEIGVHSQVLSLSSQVFAAMLDSPMVESGTKRIKVDVSGKNEFNEFYKLLNPQTSRISKITAGLRAGEWRVGGAGWEVEGGRCRVGAWGLGMAGWRREVTGGG